MIFNYKGNKIMQDYQTFKALFLSRIQVFSIDLDTKLAIVRYFLLKPVADIG